MEDVRTRFGTALRSRRTKLGVSPNSALHFRHRSNVIRGNVECVY
jgi:hypothetical protein